MISLAFNFVMFIVSRTDLILKNIRITLKMSMNSMNVRKRTDGQLMINLNLANYNLILTVLLEKRN